MSAYEITKKGNKPNLLIVERNTEVGEVLTTYNELDEVNRSRLMGIRLRVLGRLRRMQIIWLVSWIMIRMFESTRDWMTTRTRVILQIVHLK